MASIAIRGPPSMRARTGSGLGRDDFAAVIMAASRAHVVRQLQFAAIGAFLERSGLQPMMAAAHVALGRRGFSLRDSHCGTFDTIGTTIKIATICASSRQGPFGGSPRAALGSSRTAAPIAHGEAVASVAWECDGASREDPPIMPVPVTLTTTAACAFLNMWLGARVG